MKCCEHEKGRARDSSRPSKGSVPMTTGYQPKSTPQGSEGKGYQPKNVK